MSNELKRKPTKAEVERLRNLLWIRQVISTESNKLFDSIFSDFAEIQAKNSELQTLEWLHPKIENLVKEERPNGEIEDYTIGETFAEMAKLLFDKEIENVENVENVGKVDFGDVQKLAGLLNQSAKNYESQRELLTAKSTIKQRTADIATAETKLNAHHERLSEIKEDNLTYTMSFNAAFKDRPEYKEIREEVEFLEEEIKSAEENIGKFKEEIAAAEKNLAKIAKIAEMENAAKAKIAALETAKTAEKTKVANLEQSEKMAKTAKILAILANSKEEKNTSEESQKKNVDVQKTDNAAEIVLEENEKNEETSEKPLRILITGTMSAGKSTLINAITGGKQAEMAAEARTADIGYFENTLLKPFKTWIAPPPQVTIIDTPGVNAALNPEHAEVTHKALHGESQEVYDKVIYIFNADRLGTEDELDHLAYIAEKVPKEKMIFMLNKVDNFDVANDSITESLAKLRQDLRDYGYRSPQVYPISARFALLLKLELANIEFSRREQRDYALYTTLFNDEEYNLSEFYPASDKIITALPKNIAASGFDGLLLHKERVLFMAQKCGILGLERILFGGEQKSRD
ncbi:MAG: 50S ribosome-binding GTPase [Firmicutes bacterium]|nr:50S ribosome-binding GTPase [Bacillota bacterium]